MAESDIDMAINVANDYQKAFKFEYERGVSPSAEGLLAYQLPNEGFNLDRWVTNELRPTVDREHWLLVLTSLPYSELGAGPIQLDSFLRL